MIILVGWLESEWSLLKLREVFAHQLHPAEFIILNEFIEIIQRDEAADLSIVSEDSKIEVSKEDLDLVTTQRVVAFSRPPLVNESSLEYGIYLLSSLCNKLLCETTFQMAISKAEGSIMISEADQVRSFVSHTS